nr:hypothetical protein [Mycoplasmopsis bovis]
MKWVLLTLAISNRRTIKIKKIDGTKHLEALLAKNRPTKLGQTN